MYTAGVKNNPDINVLTNCNINLEIPSLPFNDIGNPLTNDDLNVSNNPKFNIKAITKAITAENIK